jgi:hypothetical protein
VRSSDTTSSSNRQFTTNFYSYTRHTYANTDSEHFSNTYTNTYANTDSEHFSNTYTNTYA